MSTRESQNDKIGVSLDRLKATSSRKPGLLSDLVKAESLECQKEE